MQSSDEFRFHNIIKTSGEVNVVALGPKGHSGGVGHRLSLTSRLFLRMIIWHIGRTKLYPTLTLQMVHNNIYMNKEWGCAEPNYKFSNLGTRSRSLSSPRIYSLITRRIVIQQSKCWLMVSPHSILIFPLTSGGSDQPPLECVIKLQKVGHILYSVVGCSFGSLLGIADENWFYLVSKYLFKIYATIDVPRK